MQPSNQYQNQFNNRIDNYLNYCAWHDCPRQAVDAVDSQTRKRIKLPACSNHQKEISDVRKLYKKFSELTEDLATYFSDDFERNKQLTIIKMIEGSVETEIAAREQQTNSIKKMYQNEEHQRYLNSRKEYLVQIKEILKNWKS